MINYFTEDIEYDIENKEKITEWILNSLKEENKISGELSFIFCSDKYLLKINKEYLKHDYYTDIITFDYSEKNQISGDIFISIDRVGENAKIYSQEKLTELLRVIIHGVLHLIGYNDKSENEQKLMTKKENYYLEKWTKSMI